MYHLGVIIHASVAGTLNQNKINNFDETYFIIDLNNGKTLSLKGNKKVKYSDIVSSTEEMIMISTNVMIITSTIT